MMVLSLIVCMRTVAMVQKYDIDASAGESIYQCKSRSIVYYMLYIDFRVQNHAFCNNREFAQTT